MLFSPNKFTFISNGMYWLSVCRKSRHLRVQPKHFLKQQRYGLEERFPSEDKEHIWFLHSQFFPGFVGQLPPPCCLTSHYLTRLIVCISNSYISGFLSASPEEAYNALNRTRMKPVSMKNFVQQNSVFLSTAALRAVHTAASRHYHKTANFFQVCLFVIQNTVKSLQNTQLL